MHKHLLLQAAPALDMAFWSKDVRRGWQGSTFSPSSDRPSQGAGRGVSPGSGGPGGAGMGEKVPT